MLEYVREIFSESKTFAIFIATTIVAMFLVVFIIWMPKKDEKEFSKYNSVVLKDIYIDVGSDYIESLGFYLRYGDREKIKDKIEEDYLLYINRTKDYLITEIFSEDIVGFDRLMINTYENTVVYSTNLQYKNGNTRRMNLIEEEPYNYTIAFDDFLGCKELHSTISENGIIISVNKVYYGENIRSYEINITNTQETLVSIDLSNIKNVQLVLENMETYELKGPIVMDKLASISKGMVVNHIFDFNIPFSLQSKIDKILFNNITIGDEKYDIELRI